MKIQYRKFLNLLLFFKWIINNLPFFCFLSSTYPKSRTFLADFRQKFKDLVPVLLKNWPLTPSWHSPAAPRPDPWSPRGTQPGPWSMITKILSEFLPIDHWSRPDNWRKCYSLVSPSPLWAPLGPFGVGTGLDWVGIGSGGIGDSGVGD